VTDAAEDEFDPKELDLDPEVVGDFFSPEPKRKELED
jgi:hypothetical protein